MPPRKLLEVGQKFGRWTIKESGRFQLDKNGDKVYRVLVECECGTINEIFEQSLRDKKSNSCGCLQRELAKKARINITHNSSKTSTYNVWLGMKQRCLNPKNNNYHRYGGREITICERWLKFENFLADMGMRPEGLTLDRINNDGNYESSNCRWATMRTQSGNRRDNKIIDIDNQEICATEATRRLNIGESSLHVYAKRKKCTLQEAANHYLENPMVNKKILFKGIECTVTDACNNSDITPMMVYARVQRKKCTLQDAFDYIYNRIKPTVMLRGKEITIAEAAKILNIPSAYIYKQAKRANYSIQDSVDYYASKRV